MSRIQKKCLIASSGLHVLLLAILIIGPAFLIKKEEPVDQTVLTLVSTEISDSAPAAPATQVEQPPRETTPPPPATEPEPVKKPIVRPKDPEPIKPKPEIKKLDPVVAKDPTPEPPKKKEPVEQPKPAPVKVPVKLDLTVKTDDAAVKRAAIEKARQEKAEREREFNEKLANVGPNLNNKFTQGLKFTSTAIGTTGVAYNSFDAHVQSVYLNAWHPPTDMAATSSTVTVRVVIKSDGTVKSAEIVKRSGVSKLDASTADLIKRVATVGRRFPDGATESERSYTIDFNLDLKSNG